MAKNRIAYYTQEGKIHSSNINFVNYSNTFAVNTLTNILNTTIVTAGTEGSKLYGIKINNPIPFTNGTLNSSSGSGFYFSLRYSYTPPTGGTPTTTILKTLKFTKDSAMNMLTSLISNWDQTMLAIEDVKGNKYINLPPGASLSITCDVICTSTAASAVSYNLGKNDDSDPRSIKIIAYTEEY